MSEISKMKLAKTYGKHAVRVLGNRIKFSRKGWFEIVEPLPTVEAFQDIQKSAFTQPIDSVIEGAKGELESLRDELQEWYDNLPEQFQSGSKGDELQEAIDALESSLNSELDVPEWLNAVLVFAVPGDGNSRSDRGGQAAYELRQASERLDELLEEGAKLPEGLTLDADKRGEIEQLRDDLSNAADEADGVNFPGMY